jgi:hypothetical protein
LNFTIEEVCPDDNKNCRGNCTTTDFIKIGFMIENITAEVEEEYPKFSNEFLDTKVCVVPYVSYDDEGTDITVIDQKQSLPPWLRERSLATVTTPTTPNKRGRYTYTSGGRCRFCKKDNNDRRVLVTAKPISQKEAAVETCGFAESSGTASEVAQSAVLSSGKVLTEVKQVASGYDVVDVAQEYVKNATEIYKVIKDLSGKVKKPMNAAEDFCDLAKAASSNLSQTIMYRSQAEKEFETASSYASKIQDVYKSMIKARLELKKLLLEQSYEIQLKELDDLVSIERTNTEMMEEELDNQIRLAENQLKLTEDKVTTKELQARKETLVKMKKDKEAKIGKMQEEIQKMEFIYKERLEYEINVANILLEMEGAASVSEWLQKFGELLEQTIPRRLYELYQTSRAKPNGCLSSAPNVTVTIQEKESWTATRNKCRAVVT